MKYQVTINDVPISVDITETGDQLTIKVDGREIANSIVIDQEHRRIHMLLDSRSYDTEVFRNNGYTSVLLSGREFPCIVEDERLVSIRKQAGLTVTNHGTTMKAPMPGLIVKLMCAVDDRVKKGDSLLLIEAMKMENELKAPADGIIKEIHVQSGKPVDKGQILITLSGDGEKVL
jgi:biotin carboxyl carrier protein